MLNAPKLETSVSAFQGVTLEALTVMYLILFGKTIIHPVCGYFDYFLGLFDALTTRYVHSDLKFEFSAFQGVTLGAFTVMYLILVIFVTRCFLNEVYLIIFSYGKFYKYSKGFLIKQAIAPFIEDKKCYQPIISFIIPDADSPENEQDCALLSVWDHFLEYAYDFSIFSCLKNLVLFLVFFEPYEICTICKFSPRYMVSSTDYGRSERK